MCRKEGGREQRANLDSEGAKRRDCKYDMRDGKNVGIQKRIQEIFDLT